MSNVVCLFHDDCFDGLGAAWALFKRFPDATFINVKHNDPVPPDLDGKVVYLVDFCYFIQDLIEIARVAEEVHIFDHHKDKEEAVNQFIDTMRVMDFDPAKFNAVFDKSRSGALITWQALHPNLHVPKIILYISDRDLWQFQLKESAPVMAGLGTYPLDLMIWDRLFHWDADYQQTDPDHPHNRIMQTLETDGHVVMRKMTVDVERLISLTRRTINLGGYEVPLVNLPRMLASEGLSLLAKEEPFAVSYFDSAEYREYSLRSCSKNGIDVIPIAKAHGGGGHPHAAGFRVARDHELAQI